MRLLLLVGSVSLQGCVSTDRAKEARWVNTDPTVAIVSPMYGHSVSNEGTVDFLAEVDDEETPTIDLRISWTSDLDGDLFAGSPDEDGDAAFETETLSVGGHTITATVTDGDGGTAFATTLLNVFEPGEPPVVALLSPDADEQGVSGEPLMLQAVAEDPDDALQDLVLDFEIISDDQEATCSDEPDEDGVAQCEVTLEEGRVLIRVTATDPLGQLGTDELADFQIVPADEHDGDDDGFSEVDGDCDDENFTIHPEASEIVDEIDNDCDGEVDEETDTSDDDGDGMTELGGDCDDDDDMIFLGATEYLNGVDDDCDGIVDEGTIAFDDDGDCFCEGSAEVLGCTGSRSDTCLDVINPGDCNDGDEDIYPGAPELVDGIDNDCDDTIDEATDAYDDDEDGYSETEGDCDDDSPGVYPGAPEALNERDDDCDGTIDEGTIAYDDDGDCYCEGGDEVIACTGSVSTSCEDTMETGDCNDGDEDIHPFAIEVCGLIDHDCDGDIGALDDDFDRDADGFSTCEGVDCDDSDPNIHPDAPEYCNGRDDDCNDVIDDDAVDTSTWYFDGDGDGYGSTTVTVEVCAAPAGYVSASGDCNDGDDSIHPGAPEVCDDDNVDEDCDGLADESDALGKTLWFLDTDSDGYASSSELLAAYMCDAYGSYIAPPDDGLWDCDDTREDINPGAEERCDWFELDEDCDGEINEPGTLDGTIFYYDRDGDGFGNPFDSERRCALDGETPDGLTLDNTDCCDWDVNAKPSATTAKNYPNLCGDYDWDCDGAETKKWTDGGGCGWGVSTDSCRAEPEGWASDIPDCGETEDWVRNCEVTYSFSGIRCNRKITTPQRQACL